MSDSFKSHSHYLLMLQVSLALFATLFAVLRFCTLLYLARLPQLLLPWRLKTFLPGQSQYPILDKLCTAKEYHRCHIIDKKIGLPIKSFLYIEANSKTVSLHQQLTAHQHMSNYQTSHKSTAHICATFPIS